MNDVGASQIEKVAKLESEVVRLRQDVTSMNHKLDELLALRNKGAGAFWAITIISGTGLATFATWIISLFKGG